MRHKAIICCKLTAGTALLYLGLSIPMVYEYGIDGFVILAAALASLTLSLAIIAAGILLIVSLFQD